MSGQLIILVITLFIIALPRRLAPVALILAACYSTLGQQIEVFGLNFFSFRIIILFGWVRILLKKEYQFIKFNKIDKVILLWVFTSVITYSLLYMSTQAFIYKIGFAYNSFGLYFLFRAFVSDLGDLQILLKITCIVIAPLSILLLYENVSGQNVFGALGGVEELSEIRSDKVRSQGPFRHPILSGTFGATLFPLIVSLLWQKKNFVIVLSGIISCIIIVITSSSSGPLMAFVSGILGMSFWRFKKHVRKVRWCIFVLLFVLHFIIMKASVWYLFDRIAGVIGGGGWYRAELINQAVNHFSDWWIIGTIDTSEWMPFSLTPDKADITNQFIGEGVNGGLPTLSLFVILIVLSFKVIGKAISLYSDDLFLNQIAYWSIGVSLLAHVVSFFSVGYFDQIIIKWFLLLGTIGSIEQKMKSGDHTKSRLRLSGSSLTFRVPEKQKQRIY